MKRTLFITIGSVSLVVIFAFWLYLLLYGTPRSVDEVVGDFGFGGVTATPITPTAEISPEERQLDLATGSFYQLTTKPVAGFGFVDSETGGLNILYAERGTGHVYRISLESGTESRILQKTFVAVNRAFFSPDGTAVVLVGESESGSVSELQELDPDKTPHEFPVNAENIAFVAPREVHYTITGSEGTTGYSYDLDSAETNALFFTALKDINVIRSASGNMISSRTATELSGTTYEIVGNVMSQIGFSGTSYSAMAHPNFIDVLVETYRHQSNGLLVSRVGDISLGISAFREKCVFHPEMSQILWCGAPVGFTAPTTYTDWFKGLSTFSDLLWEVDLVTGTAVEIENLFETSGRQLDVIDPTSDARGEHLLFKNKNDDTLWLKRLSATTDEELLSDGEEITDGEI